jgi:hypothetical protein
VVPKGPTLEKKHWGQPEGKNGIPGRDLNATTTAKQGKCRRGPETIGLEVIKLTAGSFVSIP